MSYVCKMKHKEKVHDNDYISVYPKFESFDIVSELSHKLGKTGLFWLNQRGEGFKRK